MLVAGADLNAQSTRLNLLGSTPPALCPALGAKTRTNGAPQGAATGTWHVSRWRQLPAGRLLCKPALVRRDGASFPHVQQPSTG